MSGLFTWLDGGGYSYRAETIVARWNDALDARLYFVAQPHGAGFYAVDDGFGNLVEVQQ